MYAVVYKVILRTGLFELIEIGSNYDAWCWGYDFFNTFTILLNLAVSIMYTFDNMEMKYGPLLLTLERLTIAFFAIDFLLRVFTAKYLYPDVSEPRAVWKYLISFSGIWRAASTLLTVGYGDIYPVTTMGKIFGIFIAFLGVGMVAIPTGIISAGFVDQYSRLKRIGEYGQEEDVHFIRICLDKNDKWIGHFLKEIPLSFIPRLTWRMLMIWIFEKLFRQQLCLTDFLNGLIGILSDYFQSAIDGFSCSMLESIQIRRHLRFYPKHRVDFSGSLLLKSDYFSPHNYPLR